MNNQAKAVADLLIDKGLIQTSDIVDGNYQVMDVSRRNQNYLVECGATDGYFIKQVKSANPQATASFQCEAAVHWLAQNDPDFAPVRRLSPCCRGYDPQRNLLVMDLVKNSQTFTEVLQQGLPHHLAVQVGQQMALTHWHTGRQTLQANKPSPFARNVPWILGIPALQIEHLSSLSEGCRQLILLVQTTPQLAAVLTDIKSAWRTTTFIHGDLKPDNCLIINDPGEQDSSVRFIDWELADFGDPAWDIAALLQGIWIPCLLQHGAVDSSLSFISSTQAQIKTLLQTYLASSAIPLDDWQGMQIRAVQFTAARMIQCAYEMLHTSATIDAHALLILQAACLIYANPHAIVVPMVLHT